MTTGKSALLTFVSLLAAAGLSLQCSDRRVVPIEWLLENCELLLEEEVCFKGIVNLSKDIPLVKWDIYKIYGNTGEVWVVTRRGCPVAGDQLIVRGKPMSTDRFIQKLNLPPRLIQPILKFLGEFEVGECIIQEVGKQIIWK